MVPNHNIGRDSAFIKFPNLFEKKETKESFAYTLEEDVMVIGRSYYHKVLKTLIIPIRKSIKDSNGNVISVMTAGINVNKILVIVYSLCGLLAGFGALILAGRADSGYPNAGLNAELDAIAACIIGGASFFGGRGTVLGVFAGVMIMGILRNGLNLNDVSAFWQQVLIGSIIVVAVYVDVLRKDLGTRK